MLKDKTEFILSYILRPTGLLLIFIIVFSYRSVAQENLYSPDTSMIVLDSIDFSNRPELFNPGSSDFYNIFDTLYIRRYKQDMKYFTDTVLIAMDTNFFPPCKGPVISQYGPRGSRVHTGIDIRLNEGDTVYAAFDGIVRISRVFSGYGKFVLLRHENGLETAYAHFSKLLVKVNDTVTAGQPIGLGGRTGRATCNHLHFETRMFGEPMNPNIFFDFSNHSLKKDSFQITASSFSLKRDTPANHNLGNGQPQMSASAEVNSYIIRQGDTLYSLAKRYKTSVKVLCELNKINEKKVLKIGQIIKVPTR